MSTFRPRITIVKGDGVYPLPRIRRIYPDKALLWKFILEAFIAWLFVLLALLMFTTLFSWIGSRKINPAFFTTPEYQLFVIVLFIVLTLILGPLVLLCLYLYVRSMEFIVHGDEIIVKKGLFNKTVKHCPFRTITNISTHVGPLDRIFELGSIHIQNSGSSGSAGKKSEEILEGLRVYREIREYIITQIRIVGGSGSSSKETLQQAILEELSLVKGGFRDFKRKKKR